ncbi:MAG: hypothetical protein HND54_02455 [Bacteroidetes bacterium]|nr:hypothetical protein [Bacteroidota bacterium]NOG56577.1 hypothetical protein [Bacteroidota bacterium]
MLNRLFFTVCFLFSSLLLCSQGFSDNFSDGDFINNPTWVGETSKFQVNSAKQLQLNDASKSSPAYLATTSTAISNATWEFYVHLDFAPSTSNYGQVYLVSDKADLTGSLTGYFVKIGGVSGTVDDVSLYRQNGTTSTLLIDGLDGTAGNDPVDLKIKVTRDSLGKWELFTDLTATGNSYTSEGVSTDNSISQSSFFGVLCTYTSTRFDKFWFDDFNVIGLVYQDTLAPKLLAVNVVNNNTIELDFNENIDTTSAKLISNYTVNKGIGNPASISFLADSSMLQMTFINSFLNGEEYEIEVQNIKDRSGNSMLKDTMEFLYFIPQAAVYRDIVINEIMADPSPQVGLPDAEFIEIYNASNKVFDLNNWTFSDRSTSLKLGTYLLKPGDYLILCSQSSEMAFVTYGKTLALTSFPSLGNSDDDLLLKDDNGNLIDQVFYNDTWYNNSVKKDGGYTLEQINPLKPCTGQNNFRASLDPSGGTPGTQNSVYNTTPDLTPPKLVEVQVLSETTLILMFDETLDEASIDTASYLFSNGDTIVSRSGIKPELSNISLVLSSKLDSGQVVYVSVTGLADCSGNLIENNSTRFALSELAEAGDIVINEVLFNPKTGGSDFVEYYNRSEKIISLKDWQLANYAYDSISNKTSLFKEPFLLYPKEYVVLTKSKNYVVGAYPNAKADRIVEVSSMPSYNDDEGQVYFLDNNNRVIDFFNYTDDMHFPLLSNKEGVTLERVDPNRGTNEQGNFQSASEREGFGTPGYLNSQSFTNTSFDGDFTVDPELFSPDNDGYHDVVNFNYQFNAPGFVANVSIFDRQGRLIKELIKNELLGSKGTFTWDGIKDDGTKANIGIYIIFFEVFNISGDQEIYKKSCVLAGKI